MKVRRAQAALVNLVDRVAHVRRWLVALAFLKVAAAGLTFVGLYVALYAIADHYLRIGAPGRIAALVILGAGVVVLLYYLARTLGAHMSYSASARRIESRMNLDQQLVTAIEYYEKERHYPYSRALAEHVVLRIHAATRRLRFDRAVPKWQAHLSAAVILIGLAAGAFFFYNNYLFFSTYLARLTRPLDDVAPLPATTLVALTEDISVEYGTPFAVEAEIRGRVPEEGSLEVEPSPPAQEATQEEPQEEPDALLSIPVFPAYSDEALPRFTAEPSPEVGTYRYRFTAAQAATDWHTIRVSTLPKIKNISAEVTLPGSTLVKPYTREVENYSLEVLAGSTVKLSIEATEPLAEVLVKGLYGGETALSADGKSTFEVEFLADISGKMTFALESHAGVTNERIPPLEVALKRNEPPTLEMVSPGGDYLTTDVASVPITFEIKDDFGLKGAWLCLETAGRKPVEIEIPVEEGARSVTFTRTLELEEYLLDLGDSIIFFAKADDIDITTRETPRPSAASDINFIEIRPYRVFWFGERPGGPPEGGPQEPEERDVQQMHDALVEVLEYSRAILKKTWTIANKETLSGSDHARLNSIKDDVNYSIKQLNLIRDDPRYEFTPTEIVSVENSMASFDKAAWQLAISKASAAIPPEKQAYRELRYLVDELAKLCPPGGGVPPEKPDKIKVEDRVHLKRYDSDRADAETERISQQIEQAALEERRLQDSFDHFLDQQKKPPMYSQQTTDLTTWRDPSQPAPGPESEEEGPRPAGAGSPSPISLEGSIPTPTGSSPVPGQTPYPATGRNASPAERMRMFQARQAALQKKAASLRNALASLPREDPAGGDGQGGRRNEGRQAAGKHLDEAEKAMARFQETVKEQYFKEEMEAEGTTAAADELQRAADFLDRAHYALSEALQDDGDTKDPLVLAEELIELAGKFEQSADPQTKVQLANAVAGAKDTLSQMEAAVPGRGRGEGGGQGLADGATEGVYSTMELPKLARYLAMRFYTLAMQLKKKPSGVVDDQPSSAELYRMENKFFEDAAHYKREADGK